MRALLDELISLISEGPVALARIIDATGAGPRELGAAMVVSADGRVVGSLSGGCVESAVVESARGVLAGGPPVLDRFGYADGAGFAIGLTCGGEMEVGVERVDARRLPLLLALCAEVAAGRPVALVSTFDARNEWTLLRCDVDAPWHGVDRDARALLAAGRSGLVGAQECAAERDPRPRAFVQVFARPARMILAGANDFVRALSRVGRQLGYRVTVVDARETFTTPARFPAAHEVVVDWPHRYLAAEAAAGRIDERTVVLVLTHDIKFDIPFIVTALRLPSLGFLGALGSRRTHIERMAHLREAGLSEAELRRLHSPVGIDLNARTPDETAISIAAQLLSEREQATGRPLSKTEGPIHH
ncbi:XdhC/CoxI family protein [Nocardia panacis]|uniref:XdhC/CoxI family protein n=1 Tax=Nocardia panacis TaxID=2340916 RepID=A0A3A4KDU7_9NOCA|nr:XdhC/CoxI family protein [Nocardia panacis]RJO80378.1 XdhC/CoxI family protein [Nocardia panacis]